MCLYGQVEKSFLEGADERTGLNDRLLALGVVVKTGLVAEREAGVGEAALLEVVVDEQIDLCALARRQHRRRGGCCCRWLQRWRRQWW